MAGSTTSTTITHGITLGSGSYLIPLTITSTGDIAPSAYGATGVSAAVSGGYILNQGTILGGGGGYLGNAGIGVNLAAGSLTNIGTVAGGNGGNGGGSLGAKGGNGGNGVYLAGGSLTNDGTVTGGTGGNGGGGVHTGGTGGTGGNGVYIMTGNLTNQGTIVGGAGGPGGIGSSGGKGGTGGNGVYIVTGNLTNQGTIVGGAGGPGVSGNVGNGGIGVLFHNGGMLTDAGFVGGGSGAGGTADAVYFGSGASRLILDPGALFSGAVVANAAYGNVLELASAGSAGTVAGLGSAVTGFGTLQFDTNAAWLIEGNSAGLAAGQTIDGFALGDTIELTGFVATGNSFIGNDLVLTGTGGPETIAFQSSFAAHVSATAGNTFIEVLPCFAAGTLNGTPRGEVPVEQLRPGETVLAHAGAGEAVPKPIVWIGRRSVDCRRHPEPRKVWPVRVRAGAFGDGAPRRDLFLSPDHAVFVDDALIPIKHLINGASIEQVPMDAVTYYHVELPRHDVLLAEGLPAESYLDSGDRANFADSGGATRLFADFSTRASDACALWEAYGCALLIVSGPKLDAVRRRLSERAATRERRKAVATGRAVA